MAGDTPRDAFVTGETVVRKAAVDARLDEAVRAGAPIREVYDLIQESA